MKFTTGFTIDHIHGYDIGTGITSMVNGHTHSTQPGTGRTSTNEGHSHTMVDHIDEIQNDTQI